MAYPTIQRSIMSLFENAKQILIDDLNIREWETEKFYRWVRKTLTMEKRQDQKPGSWLSYITKSGNRGLILFTKSYGFIIIQIKRVTEELIGLYYILQSAYLEDNKDVIQDNTTQYSKDLERLFESAFR